LNRFVRDRQPPSGFSAQVSWVRILNEEREYEEGELKKLKTSKTVLMEVY